MAITEKPILSRLDLLDNLIKQVEEIRGCKTPKSSCESTASSGTLTSDGHPSTVDYFSPKCLEKYCRPIDDVVIETEAKGTLIDRLDHLEDRVFKLCLQLEEELEHVEKKKSGEINEEKKVHKKGLKQLVKQCVKRNKTKHGAR